MPHLPRTNTPAPDQLVVVDTPVGPIVFERKPDRTTAYLSYQGGEFLFPEPYASEPDLPVGRFLSGIAGSVVRSLASRARFVWHANDDVALQVDYEPQSRVRRTAVLDSAMELLARALTAEVDAGEVLRLFRAESDELDDPIIWRAGHTRIHIHRTHEERRRAYLGRLAPLGGVSLNAILPELGYVEVRSALPDDLPESISPRESSRYLGWGRGAPGPFSAWVKPAYRAVNKLVEALALVAEIPAVDDTELLLPELRLAYDAVDAVDPELGYAFVRGLRLEARNRVVAAVDQIMSLEYPAFVAQLPADLVRDIETAAQKRDARARRIVPRSRGELPTLGEHIPVLARAVAHDLTGRIEHPLHVERFTRFPDFDTHERGSGGRYSMPRQGNGLPALVWPDLDERGFEMEAVRYLQRDLNRNVHPTAARGLALADEARREVLPLLDQALNEGVERVRAARDALLHAVDLLSRIGLEGLDDPPSRAPEAPAADPARLHPGEIRWWPLPEGEAPGWEGSLLVFAINRNHEAVPVPSGFVAELVAAPEPVLLPTAWEWRVGVIRFVGMAIARRGPDGPHVLGRAVRLAGLDRTTGWNVVVLMEDKDWAPLARAILSRLRIVGGDVERVERSLVQGARLSRVLPDGNVPEVAETLIEEWLPRNLSNLALQMVLERAPAVDVEAEVEKVRALAPRLVQALHRWPNLRPVIGDEISLGAQEVDVYGYIREVPVLTLPEDVWRASQINPPVEIVGHNIVLLECGPSDSGVEGNGRRSVWLREVDGELRLEWGIFEILDGVVVRIVGEAAQDGGESSLDVTHSYGRRAVRMAPGRLPRIREEVGAGAAEVLRRSPPRTAERGGEVGSTGASAATILEAYRETGTYTGAARLLSVWGAKVSASTLGAQIRTIRIEQPALYFAVVGE